MIKSIVPLATVTISSLARAKAYNIIANSNLHKSTLRRLADAQNSLNLEAYQDVLNLDPWSTTSKSHQFNDEEIRFAWYRADAPNPFVNHIKNQDEAPEYFKSFIRDEVTNPEWKAFLDEADLTQLPRDGDLEILNAMFAEYAEYVPEELATYVADGIQTVPQVVETAFQEEVHDFSWDTSQMWLVLLPLILMIGVLVLVNVRYNKNWGDVSCGMWVSGVSSVVGCAVMGSGFVMNGLSTAHNDFMEQGTDWMNDNIIGQNLISDGDTTTTALMSETADILPFLLVGLGTLVFVFAYVVHFCTKSRF